MDEEYIGRATTIETVCTKNDKNQWRVVQKITHKRSKDGENWEEKHLEMQSFASNLEVALTNVFYSIESYLAKRNHDLFMELPVSTERDD